MSFSKWLRSTLALLAAVVLLAGCGKGDDKGSGPAKDTKAQAANKHAGWWCDEDGVPEEECSICSKKAAKEFKAKGDWCAEHDRAKSQCFICDPSLREKYAKIYRAREGKEPPEPTNNMAKKDK
jgi:hypothetical protein